MLWSLLSYVLAACVAAESGETSPGSAASADDGFYLGEPASDLERANALMPLAAPAEAPAPQPAVPAAERSVIYSAALRIVVVSARESFAAIHALATESGGYLQESDAHSITIRVPAAKFDEVVARISSLGEVAERSIRAADVTEEMLDLGIRLENARKARERLLEHLAKSDKMEDTLAIERELARVTGEIEQMEGRLRYMQSQIAMSTIRVELNTTTPQDPGNDGLGLPFEWIERLGDGLVAGSVQALPRKPHVFSRGPDFDPPPSFVRYYSKSDLVEAMDATGLRLKLQEQDNFDEGALAFWSQLARKSLVQRRALAVTEERDLGGDRALVTGTREVGGESYGYLLVLTRTKKHLYSFEAWGPQSLFDARLAELVASAKSLDP